MDKKKTSPLEVARKELYRKKGGELTLDVLTAATDLALTRDSNSNDVDILAYSTVLLRQLTVSLPTPGVIELVNSRVAPALQPRGALASLIMPNLAHALKSRAMRAAECLTAAVKLDAELPPSTSTSSSSSSARPHLLGSLFADVVRDSLGHRSNLMGITIMAETMPDEIVPADLLPRLLADLDEADAAAQRCNAIVALLGRRRAGVAEEERDRVMLEPLIPHLGGEESVPTMSRYLLPALFKVHRHSFDALLALLDTEARTKDSYFGAWVATASYGVSSGYISLTGLPEDRLREAISHADIAIRVMAFELLAHSRAVFEPAVMELVKHALVINTMIPTAGGRTDMLSAVHGFLANTLALEGVAGREVAKGAKGKPGAAERASAALEISAAFHKWWLDEYLSPSIKACREMPPLRSIFALKLLKLYIDVYGSAVHEAVYTPARVADLIACQASEFVDSRVTARNLIAQAPLPLAEFESLQSPSAQRLLQSARESINHPRRTQADAGRAALCIVFTKLVLPTGQGPALAFVGDLIELLERHVQKVEENLAKGIVEYPLHGPLSAIVELVHCLDLRSPEAQNAWSPTLHALYALVQRVWAATRKVISLGPSDENDTAAHEIARAYEVIGEDEEGDDALDHTNLLSGCWRAMREAAELLSAIITVPLAAKEQTVWSAAEVDAAGRTFLTWLHEIRHRGTFSKIAPALGSVVLAVRQRDGLAHLVNQWVDAELATVEEGRLSTLRRSAALPYSFLALVSGDAAQLDRAVDRLLTLASVVSPSSDPTKVHAMNTLKIVLLDAKQARLYPRYLERTLTVSLQAFGSANWNVRNVGLILFSTLTNRALSTSRPQDEAGRAALAARQTLASWHAKYPSLVPFITTYLRAARGKGPTALGEHSPLFPLLIILRSLRWSADAESLAEALFAAVEPFLGSVEWQVREVASQALSSLLSPERALEKAKVTATRVSHSSDDLNLLHGRLLFLQRLVDDVLDWPAVCQPDRELMEGRLQGALGEWGAVSHPVIPAAILDCMAAYAAAVRASGPASGQEVKATEARSHAEGEHITLLSAATSAAQGFLRAPRQVGADLLYVASARLIILTDDADHGVVSLLAPSVPEDAQLLGLGAISASALYTPTTLGAVTNLARKGSNAVRTAALDVIAAWPSGDSESEVEREIAALADEALRLASHARSVPLKEAALGALGRALSSSSTPERLGDLAALVASAAHEDQSEPCRASALAALTPLASRLYSLNSASLLRSLLVLLEDDDIDIRTGAADVISRAAGRARSVDQATAVDMWWAWLGKHVEQARDEWEEWLWDLVTGPASDAGENANGNGGEGVTLFVEEPPNMFRDPLASAARAAEVLAALPRRDSVGRTRAQALVESGAARTTEEVSPIDGRWAAAHLNARRTAALEHALRRR